MSRIDTPIHPNTTSNGVSKSDLAHGIAPSAIRIERMRGLNSRLSVEARRRLKQMQGLMSATQVGAAEIGGLREMPREEIVTRLSRMLVVGERAVDAGGDAIDDLFCTIAREHIRRMMLCHKKEG
ncbi:MAG: hypothetical protein R3D34_17280 [Nitratireductor sp.]